MKIANKDNCLKRLEEHFQSQNQCINDNNGKTIQESEDILKQWHDDDNRLF